MHQDHRRLIQSRAKAAITGFGDLSYDVHFPRLSAPRRQPRPRTNVFRSRETGRIVDRGSDGQSNNWADTRHRRHQTADIVVLCQPSNLRVQRRQLGPQLLPGTQKCRRRGGQDFVLGDQFSYPVLVPDPGDVSEL